MMEILSSFAVFMKEGGGIMYWIGLVYLLGIFVCIEKFIRLRQYNVNASSFMNEIQKLVLANKIKDAIQYCSGTTALLPMIIKNALKRSNQGIEQIQNAVDASALGAVPLLDRRVHLINVCANVSTLLGLLGTIMGLIESFKSIKVADPAEKAAILGQGIAFAMNATAFGLISAITLILVHSWLIGVIEKITADIDEYSVKILDLLGTIKINSKQTGVSSDD